MSFICGGSQHFNIKNPEKIQRKNKPDDWEGKEGLLLS